MFDWLNGPGQVFKHPLTGSTNYLSAYDRKGKLLRVDDAEGEGKSPQQDGQAVVPKESKADLRPFPLNPLFMSESVLSEDLRNRIYEEVVENKKSVRTVSVLYGVDMRRVAAVVRLVTLEKQMVREVCSDFFSAAVLELASTSRAFL